MKTGGILIILLLITSPVYSWSLDQADPWTKTDITLEIIDLGLKFMDAKQTHDIVSRQNEGYYETNFILGEHPSHGEVNAYFATTAIGHILIAHILPQPYRRYWQILWIGVSGSCVYGNYRSNLKIKF